MITRRAVLIASALFALPSVPTLAGASAPYTDAAFEAAKKENKPILIEIAADWCPTCKAQEPILSDLLANDDFKNMVALRVDFDTQKDVVRSLGAQSQSTLIVFVGEKEVGRSVADTNAASIEDLLRRAF
ncbi:MAG: thioredoxin family protein [Rhizobiales bacterium]|nr:thioredoxin family protein [Hyphomicrobiales bacterium]